MTFDETLKFLKNNPWNFYYVDPPKTGMNTGTDYNQIMIYKPVDNPTNDYHVRHEVIDEIGNLINIQEIPSGWVGIDKYNFDMVDHILDQLLKGYPDRYFIPRVHLEPPDDWLRANPREVFIYYGGPQTEKEISAAIGSDIYDDRGWDMDSNKKVARQSFSSKKWVKDACEALKKFVEHLENSPYGKQVIGYMTMMGNCGENMLWGDWVPQGSLNKGDFGLGHKEEFYKYCLEKYGSLEGIRKAWNDPNLTYETFRVPYPNERWSFKAPNVQYGSNLPCEAGSSYWYDSVYNFLDLKNMRDVVLADDQRQVDCNIFHSKVTFDAIEEFAKVVKEMTGKVVGGFYGYLQDPTVGYAGHCAIDRALTTPYIDFYSSPKAYHYCLAGDPGASQAPGQTFARHKMWIEECDMRSHHRGDCYSPKTATDTEYCFWRELYRALTFKQGFWWMDINGTNDDWYTDPKMIEMFKKQTKFYQKWSPIERKSVAEVLFVEDTASCEHMTYLTAQQFGLRYKLERELKLCGAPVDHFLIDDLYDMDLSQYKVIVFCHAFVLPAEKWNMIKNRMNKDATVIWNYCAGIIGDKYSEENQFQVTGFNTVDCPDRMEYKDRYHHIYWHCDAIVPYDDPLLEIVRTPDIEVLQETPDKHIITAKKKIGELTSIMACDIVLRTPILRTILEEANVKFYAPAYNTVLADDKLAGFFAKYDTIFPYTFEGNWRNVITGETVTGTVDLKIKGKYFEIFEKID